MQENEQDNNPKPSSLELKTQFQSSSVLEEYINSRVKRSKEEYQAALHHDRNCVDRVNRSGKRYVVISSSNSSLEKALILSIGAEYLRQNNNYYIINHYGAHWDTSVIEDNNLKTNINSAGADLACGCYTILQIIADDPNIIDQGKIAQSSVLSGMLQAINNDLKESHDRAGYINKLKSEDVRKLVSQAILNSDDPNKEKRAENVLRSKYELSNDDIAAALNGLGINYVERSQLHNVAHGFEESDMDERKNRIRRILKKQEGGTAELREKLYNEELSEFSSFLCKQGLSDLQIGNILAEIEEGCEELEEKKEQKTKMEEKHGQQPQNQSQGDSVSVHVSSVTSSSSSLDKPQSESELKQHDQGFSAELQEFLTKLRNNDPNLTTFNLDLNNDTITDAELRAIAKALENNKFLTSLFLWDPNKRHDAYAYNYGNHSWSIQGNPIRLQIDGYLKRNQELAKQAEFQSYLERLKSNYPNLTEINLNNSKVTDEDARALGDALEVNNTLTRINLRSNKITDEGAMGIAHAIKANQTLTSIDLYDNQINDLGAIAIAEALEGNQTLTELELVSKYSYHDKSPINEKIRSQIDGYLKRNQELARQAKFQNYLERLKNNDSSLTWINLNTNTISDVEAEALAKVLENNMFLTTFYLQNSWNCKDDPIRLKINSYLERNQEISKQARLQDFLTKLRNNDPKLVTAYLDSDTITNEVGLEIIKILETSTFLTSIDSFIYSEIDEKIRSQINTYLERNQEIARRAKLDEFLTKLKNNDPRLTYISFALNKITDEEAREVGEAIKANRTLTSINLENNKITEALSAALVGALEVNTTLTSINLGGNTEYDNYYDSRDESYRSKEIGYQSLIDEPKYSPIKNRLERNRTIMKFQDYLTKLRNNNSNLTSINLYGDAITDKEIEVLAKEIRDHKTLTSIHISSNAITDVGARIIAEVLKTNKVLTSVDFGSHKANISKEILSQIEGYVERNKEPERQASLQNFLAKLKSNYPALTEINLYVHKITNEEYRRIADAIKFNKTATKIDLYGYEIKDEGAMLIADALEVNKTLTSVSLGYDCYQIINRETSARIKTYLERNQKAIESQKRKAKLQDYIARLKNNDATLTVLNFDSNTINPEDVGNFANALRSNTHLTELDLSNNKITDPKMKILADAIKNNTTLLKVKMNKTHTNPKGAHAQHIGTYLERNKAIAGRKKLQDFVERLKVKDPALTTINLSNQNIDDEGVMALAAVLKIKKPTLTEINLQFNSITDKGANALAEALRISGNSISINLSSNKTSKETPKNFGEIKKHNDVVQKVLTGKAVVSEIAASDAGRILPQPLQGITSVFDDRVIEGSGIEGFLKEAGVYNQCFDEQGLPKGEFPNPHLLRYNESNKKTFTDQEAKLDWYKKGLKIEEKKSDLSSSSLSVNSRLEPVSSTLAASQPQESINTNSGVVLNSNPPSPSSSPRQPQVGSQLKQQNQQRDTPPS